MHEHFLEGWALQKEGKFVEAVDCYKRGMEMGDKCALFQYHCMDRYGQGIPINYDNMIQWSSFKLKAEEFECLRSCYEGDDRVESMYNLGMVYDLYGDLQNALVYLKLAKDYPPAEVYLAWFYVEGKGVPVDYEEAEKLYRKNIDNYTRAAIGLGWSFFKRKEYDQSIYWFTLAHEHGAVYALCDLASLYIEDKNYELAYKYYQQATLLGHAEGQFGLGVMYRNGSFVPKDDIEATRLYLLAADQGHKSAQYNLGVAYKNGRVVPVDHEMALKYFKLAGNYNIYGYRDVDALFQIAEIYKHKFLDYVRARVYYKLVTEYPENRNYKQACFNLGLLYDRGKGGPSDYIEALKYYQLAQIPEADYNIGLLYANGGHGVPQDYGMAIQWYRKAIDAGYVQAYNGLGLYYEHEIKDYEEAIKYYQIAANNGFQFAELNLGQCYEYGLKDYNEAFKWYRLAAKHGNKSGQINLGRYYAIGQGTPINHTKALKYFLRAIPDATAFANLGSLYYDGLGVDKSLSTALEYYQKGYALGHIKCKPYIDEILLYEIYIKDTLTDYVTLNRKEGLSYLFFSNFLGYLTNRYHINEWDSSVFRSWITSALLTYFRSMNPGFSVEQIDQWFDDFY